MKKALRLNLLAGAIALASWTASEPPAHAIALCEYVHGAPCSTPGRTQRCAWETGGGQSVCVCDYDGFWYC